MRRSLIGPAVLAAALIAVHGCDRPRARVHGTVTYQGKPLGGAVVTFFGPDNMTYTADTRPDGTYEVTGVSRGAVRVSVQVPPPRPRPRPDPVPAAKGGANSPARAEDAAKAARLPDPPPVAASPPPSAIPAKYGDPNTSGLAFELKDADQAYDIALQ